MRLSLALLAAIALPAQNGLFDFDQLPPLECEPLGQPRRDAVLQGCAFAGPHGGQINLLLVTPKLAKPPYAGVLFQHGGGQSMTNYLSEALILARAGAVSMLTDAPPRGQGYISQINQTKLHQAQQLEIDVVVSLRMALCHLLNQKGVDARRVAYVGHSYGAMAGSVLAAVEPRFTTFILLGGLPSMVEHMRKNNAPYWEEMRHNMTAAEFEETLHLLSATEPSRHLPNAKGPLLIQCARFDTPDNIAGCPKVHALARGASQLTWYDDDHYFTSWEAGQDRLRWLARHLSLRVNGAWRK